MRLSVLGFWIGGIISIIIGNLVWHHFEPSRVPLINVIADVAGWSIGAIMALLIKLGKKQVEREVNERWDAMERKGHP